MMLYYNFTKKSSDQTDHVYCVILRFVLIGSNDCYLLWILLQIQKMYSNTPKSFHDCV